MFNERLKPDLANFESLWHNYGNQGDQKRGYQDFYEFGLRAAAVNLPVTIAPSGYISCKAGEFKVHFVGERAMQHDTTWPIYSEAVAPDITWRDPYKMAVMESSDGVYAENALLKLRLAEYEAKFGLLDDTNEPVAVDLAEKDRETFETWATTTAAPGSYWVVRNNDPRSMVRDRQGEKYHDGHMGEFGNFVVNLMYGVWKARGEVLGLNVENRLVRLLTERALKDSSAFTAMEGQQEKILHALTESLAEKDRTIERLLTAIPEDEQHTLLAKPDHYIPSLAKLTASDWKIELSEHEEKFGPSLMDNHKRYKSCPRCSGYETVLGLRWQLCRTQEVLDTLMKPMAG